ncbi:unnamed protein product, partial [Linum tenue]
AAAAEWLTLNLNHPLPPRSPIFFFISLYELEREVFLSLPSPLFVWLPRKSYNRKEGKMEQKRQNSRLTSHSTSW